MVTGLSEGPTFNMISYSNAKILHLLTLENMLLHWNSKQETGCSCSNQLFGWKLQQTEEK
jgi:hypothetical protein